MCATVILTRRNSNAPDLWSFSHNDRLQQLSFPGVQCVRPHLAAPRGVPL